MALTVSVWLVACDKPLSNDQDNLTVAVGVVGPVLLSFDILLLQLVWNMVEVVGPILLFLLTTIDNLNTSIMFSSHLK